MAKIISLVNQKGGVGKTTCTINIGAGLAKLNKKVLLVDLDPQACLTNSLGIAPDEVDSSIFELLKKEASLEEVVLNDNSQCPILSSQLALLPSCMDLSGIDVELSDTPGREFLLKESLKGASEFDYILVDCPPSLGLLTLNGLTASQEVYIPLQTEFLALQGMSRLLETAKVVKERLNSDLEVTGIIGTRYDKRKVLNREVIEKIGDYFGDKLFGTLIRENIALAEAPSYGEDIFTYKPGSNGARDYLSLCKEIIEKKGA